MDSQLRLDRVRGGLGGLIDSVIIRVGTDRRHVWEGKGRGVSERMSGGCGGRKEKMNGQRATEVRPAAKARGNNWRLNSKTQTEGGQAPVKGTREKEKKERKWERGDIGYDGERRNRRADNIKEERKGTMEETYRGGDFGSLRFAGID